jgi:leader peptidase (prepilin peptidase) / N-methyltransferase
VEEPPLRVNWAVVLCGAAAVAAISVAVLPWPSAALSTALGTLMVIGADVDARSYMLPDITTLGAALCGVVAGAALDPLSPWTAMAGSAARSAGTAAILALLAWGYRLRSGKEGLGRGDVKLAAAVGAWLPVGAIPLCFGLATGAALLAVLIARLRGETVSRLTRVPLGAFLCPSLWFVFFAELL